VLASIGSEEEMMETSTAGGAVVDALHAEGVRWVFGIPGGHVLSIYDALYDAPEIEHILVRHEQAAASMAAAVAQLTGEPGVCLVTAGPGATNLLSGVAEAFVGCLAMVILSGRGATATARRGAAQEVSTERIFAPVTKSAIRVDRADQVVDAVREGFAIARNGRPGPVFIDLPRDVLDSPVAALDYRPVGRAPRLAGDARAIGAAATALARADHPLIIAGGGVLASEAAGALRALAERLAIPVLSSLSGRGAIPDDHPLSGGGLGAHRTCVSKQLLADADVILGLGFRFEEMETSWRPGFVPAPEATYIQVDIDPQEIGRSVPAQIGVIGDVRSVLEQLIGALSGTDDVDWSAHPRTRALAQALASVDAEADQRAAEPRRPMHPLTPIRALRQALPREATVGFDVGCLAQHIAGAQPYFKVYEPRSTIVPSSFYGMGFVAAALPAARLVHPERPAVGFVGDGSFQMVMSVLPAAAERRLGVTWCVLNDGALGSIRDIQQYRFSERYLATAFDVQPDFAAVASACGCHGERVEDPAEVDGAVERALTANDRGVPAVLDVAVAPERMLGTLEHYSFYPDWLIQRAQAPLGAVGQ
jgi:acetolactate synthase-1/2/3 large subunit